MKHKKLIQAVPFLFMILSFCLRFHSLGLSSYWIDEMVSVRIANEHYLGSIFWDNNPVLYHLLLKGWVRLVGDSEVATRMLSVIFSTSTTGLLSYFGGLLLGLPGAIAFGLLHALSHLSISYAQETRMYALFEFAAALNMIFFYDLKKKGKHPKLYISTVAFLCFCHYLAIVPLAMQMAFLVFKSKKPKVIRKFIYAAGVSGIFILSLSYKYYFGWKYLDWQKLKFEMEPQSRWPGALAWSLGNDSWFVLGGLAALTVLFFLRYRKKLKDHSDVFTFLSFIVGPTLLFLIATFVTHRGMFLPRYFIYMVPYFITATGMMLVALYNDKKRTVRLSAIVVAAFIGLGSAYSLSDQYLSRKALWRDVATKIIESPSSVVLTTRTDSIKAPYYDRAGIKLERVVESAKLLPRILDLNKQFKNVWVIDNYWGGTPYFSDLKSGLQEAGLSATSYTVQNEYSEPVLVMKISN